MYWLYREHHISPSEYYSKGLGEKLILKAFFEREQEDIKKATNN